MNNLLDKMFLKRFCLPSNSNINDYEKGACNISGCLCIGYNHVACVFTKVNSSLSKINVLSYGVNTYADIEGKFPGIHAEKDALLKLMPLKFKKKPEIIDILVIRLSKTNKIQMSKPCSHCIKMMSVLPVNKGYKIRNVYYSNNDGYIVKSSLRSLEIEEQHISRYYKTKSKSREQ